MSKGRDFFDVFQVTSTYMDYSQPLFDSQLKHRIASIKKGSRQLSPNALRKLLRQMIKAKNPNQEVILIIIEALSEKSILTPDEYGWIPLHYACRFMSDNDSLIQILIEKSPQSVLIPDRYDRYPLHVACDNLQTTIEVIRLLLKGYAGGQIVLEQTKYLQVSQVQ